MKDTAVLFATVFGPSAKAIKLLVGLTGIHATAKHGVIMTVRYTNSFKGAGQVLSTTRWNG